MCVSVSVLHEFPKFKEFQKNLIFDLSHTKRIQKKMESEKLKKNVSENVLMSKTRETLYREGLEKQLEVNATWRRVFSIEASTANLKLSDDETRKRNNEESKRSLAELDVVRCSFRVNRLEEKLCEMRSREIKTLLKRARDAEVSALTRKLGDLKSTIDAVKRYPNVVSDSKRNEFFFSDCHQQWGLGRWYCECLSERKTWTAYPSEKWFVTKSGVQLYSPMGRMLMDFSDQSVYSQVESCLYVDVRENVDVDVRENVDVDVRENVDANSPKHTHTHTQVRHGVSLE